MYLFDCCGQVGDGVGGALHNLSFAELSYKVDQLESPTVGRVHCAIAVEL